MASTSETGHAKNVANFEKLISFCTGYGASYNPSKVSIKLPALNTLLTAANAVLLLVKTTKTTFGNTQNVREIAFAGLRKLCTKIINALEATDASQQIIDDAKTINNKIQGRRATPVRATVFNIPANGFITVDNIPSGTPFNNTGTTNLSFTPLSGSPALLVVAGQSVSVQGQFIPTIIVHNESTTTAGKFSIMTHATNSVSQQSFDGLIDNFGKFIQLLAAEPLYIPNETELKVVTLNAQLVNPLKSSNSAVIGANTAFSNVLITRNTTLYGDKTGLVDVAGEVKKYVKSVFGIRSAQFKEISALKFVKIRV